MTREQFVRMVKGEQEALRRFLLALCLGNKDEADDIAQETLIKAYISLDDYDERGRAVVVLEIYQLRHLIIIYPVFTEWSYDRRAGAFKNRCFKHQLPSNHIFA